MDLEGWLISSYPPQQISTAPAQLPTHVNGEDPLLIPAAQLTFDTSPHVPAPVPVCVKNNASRDVMQVMDSLSWSE